MQASALKATKRGNSILEAAPRVRGGPPSAGIIAVGLLACWPVGLLACWRDSAKNKLGGAWDGDMPPKTRKIAILVRFVESQERLAH
jgi:hypothetical protein